MSTHFFFTGMSRSGTTVLDKLMSMHPDLICFSQPFPYLYRYYKQLFFNKINYPNTRYVLNNLFLERRYAKEQLESFLLNHEITKEDLRTLFEDMKGFSGQYTHIDNVELLVGEFNKGNFFDTFTYIVSKLNVQKKAIKGVKETNCEEFIYPMLNNGVKCILIYRDPRDVISSLNIGKGIEYGGKHRPILFHLRNWRKSIDIGLSYKENKDLLLISYEKFLQSPISYLNTIAKFLGLTSGFNKSILSKEIVDQKGELWTGNSSEVESTKSKKELLDVNNFKKYQKCLNAETIKYIEKVCYPEMKYLGYNFENDINTLTDFELKLYKEQFDISIDDIPADFSTNNENCSDEAKRLEIYFDATKRKKCIDENYACDYFISEIALKNLVNENDISS